jgi:Condensation domain
VETTQGLEIECAGGLCGTGPATWGQKAIWSAVRQLGPDAARYNVTTSAPIPPGVPVALVLESLRELVLLHDSLRTRLVPTDTGRLEQVVDADCRLPVLRRQCPAEGADEAGRALLAELAERPFDSARQCPVRIGVVESAGQVRHMAFVLAHTAVDAWGLQRMILDLTALASGETAESINARRSSLQPLEEAAFQRSPRGLRQDEAARRHWREKLRLGPPRLFEAAPGAVDGPRFPNAVFNSPALYRALALVAAGRRASTSSVLLAAASAMLCELSGSPDAVLQLVVNNRFLPRLTHSVSTVAQEGLFYLADARLKNVGSGVGGAEFGELVRRAQAASLGVYRSAYYDKGLLDQDIARLLEQDGVSVDLSCFLNDYRGLVPQGPEQAGASMAGAESEAARGSLGRLRGRSTLNWPAEFEPRRNVTFALDALDAPGSIELAMTADGSVIPRADMERFLVGIEELVVGDALAMGAE